MNREILLMDTANESLDGKLVEIRLRFAPLKGKTIDHYQTAEVVVEGEGWTPWPSLPVRVYFTDGSLVSIAWSKFDELWIANDLSLPWSCGIEVRWVRNSVDAINGVVGRTLRSVKLGRGQFSLEDREIEIWTRLLIQVDDCWLEVFNALDENGYELHADLPVGQFIDCIG
jgi:hypothetical protein